MSYVVKEIFFTLQGEGANTGTAAVFCRFAGCNLWTGREEHRSIAVCQFCDTDFVGTDGPGGGQFPSADALADAVEAAWRPGSRHERFVVCTGGEPLLQLDDAVVEALHGRGFRIAVETNGTRAAPAGIDWTCVSPKAGAELVLRRGDELKLVFPQPGLLPDDLAAPDLDFDHHFLSPMDGPEREANTALAVEYCLAHPRWRLSLQTHKYLGIA
ncbi:MAG: 7-carboxy-7-deazaguanine synthase [Acidimicrobiales bacterium]|nr:7-carboxy-7-deazaguanine synthase [Acidimicrobiales bacterium]